MNDRTRPETSRCSMPCAPPRGRNSSSKSSRPKTRRRASRSISISRRSPPKPWRSPTRSAACSAPTSTAPIDVPPFDRSNVDGFAVRAADTAGATDAAPRRLTLNAEVLACGHAPKLTVAPGTATTIATGGMIPRGADAVVMIEHTELIDAGAPAIDLRRAVSPGTFVSYAGSDIARGETLLRRGAAISSREIGMLAACGFDKVDVVRRPRVAVFSTGDELAALGPAAAAGRGLRLQRRDHRGGGARSRRRAGRVRRVSRTTRRRSKRPCARRSKQCDIVVLSGGTSKGAGDLSHRIVSRLGAPGVLVHGVALKPGKPLCLAVAQGKPIVVLPGFPTSAIFTFHAFVAPVIRAKAGLPPEAAVTVDATVPVRIPSEMGRKEFVLVALVAGADGKIAFPIGKGSGSVTTFSQADGFPRSRRAAHRARCRHPRAGDADRAGARAGSRDRGQPLRRARCGAVGAVARRASRRAPSRSAAWAASRRRGAASAISRRST